MKFGLEAGLVVIVQHAFAVYFENAAGGEAAHQGVAHFARIHAIFAREGQRFGHGFDGDRDVHGMDIAVAANHTTLLLLSFAVGAMLSGMLSDRLGRRNPVIVGGIVLYVLCWLPVVFAWPLSSGLSYLLFSLMGLGASGFTLTWASVKEVNPPALSGMATSVINTGTFFGAAVLQPLVGWAMDQGWDGKLLEGARVYSAANYQTGLGIMLGFAVAGLLGALTIRETNCKYIVITKHV